MSSQPENARTYLAGCLGTGKEHFNIKNNNNINNSSFCSISYNSKQCKCYNNEKQYGEQIVQVG